jgi:methylthioribulose-1-phosphate dehydratase
MGGAAGSGSEEAGLGSAAARQAARELAAAGRLFYDRAWSMGTSSNYSVRLSREPLRLLVTASGKDKGALDPERDFVIVDAEARAVEPAGARPSAETWLHVVLAELPETGAVLHTHGVWGTVLTDRMEGAKELVIEGFEMLKGLDGVTTHEHRERVAIFENTQEIATLAKEVRARLAAGDPALRHGFLMRRHGLYTWGRTLFDARRQVEIFEFLFECLGRRGM